MTLSMIDAMSTGAIGDGIANDAPAIQRAIDAIPPTGGIVFFPRGVYKIDTEIAIRDRGKIKLLGVPTRLDDIGELSGSCIHRVGAGPALNIETTVESGAERVGIWIDGLHFRANGAAQLAAQPVVRVSRVFKVHIANTVITGGAAYGLLLDRLSGLTMIDTRIDRCGIGIKSAEVENNFLGNFAAFRCEFANNSTAGVEMQGTGLGFFACNFEGQQTGARISAVQCEGGLSQGVTFQNCYFEANTVQALELGSAAGVSGLTVSGCYFLLQVGTPQRYIHLVANGFAIEGNSFNVSSRDGEPFPREQILMENCHNGRIGPNSGLVSNGITYGGGNSQIVIENEGSERVGYRAVNADDTVVRTDYIIAADALAAGVTVTLPSAVGHSGRVIIIKKIDASGNAVSVVPVAGQTIDGAAIQTLAAQWEVLRVASDGANWLVV